MSEQVVSDPLPEPPEPAYTERHQVLVNRLRDMTTEQVRLLLKDSHSIAQALAAQTLGNRTDTGAVPLLIPLLRDQELYVRGKVAEALGKIGDVRAIPNLLTALREDNEIYLITAQALKEIGLEENDVLILLIDSLLTEQERVVHERVTDALGLIGEKHALSLLIQKVQQDTDTIRRIRALEAIGILRDKSAVDFLFSVFQDSDEGVRIAAQEALKHIQDFYLERNLKALRSREWWMREEAATILGQLQETRALKQLIETLLDVGEYPRVRKAAAEALGIIGDRRALDALHHTLVPEPPSNEDLVKAVIAAMEKLDGLWELANVYRDQTMISNSEREAVENALKRMIQTQWGDVLAILRDTNKDLESRELAAKLLGLLPEPDGNVVEAFIAILQDPSDKVPVRKAAVEALRLMDGPETVEPLISALKEQDLSLRVAIIETLGSTASSRAVEPLISELEEQNPDICQAAETALKQIGGVRAKKAIKRYRLKKEGYLRVAVEDGRASLQNAWTSNRHVLSWKTIVITIILAGLIIAGAKYIFRPASAPIHLLSHYPYSNSLVLDDPLRDASQGNGWNNQSITDPGTFLCLFKNDAYYAAASLNGTVQNCTASGPLFKNFTYEVQMTLVQGDLGGIVFRYIPSTEQSYYYAFYIDSQGDYLVLALYPDSKGSEHQLLSNASSAIKQGYNQTNLLAVTAYGDQLKFYINHNEVASIHYRINGASSEGTIGMSVVAFSQTTIALFKNARVWKLPDASSGDLP